MSNPKLSKPHTMAKTTTTNKKLNKLEFIGSISEKLASKYKHINEFYKISKERKLTKTEISDLFDYLYDARDLLKYYAKQLKLTENDAYMDKEFNWISNDMMNVIEKVVGTEYSITQGYDETITSTKGNVVGGDVIEIVPVPIKHQNQSVIYHNWMQIDEWFWLKDHRKEFENYNYWKETRASSVTDSRMM